MAIYLAENNDTELLQLVEVIDSIAGRTDCPECGGRGAWPWHPDGQPRECPDCKGTGEVLVSI